MDSDAALAELDTSGLDAEVVEYEPAGDAVEAARRRGVPIAALVKTIVVRRGSGDYVLVLVPGDRAIDWKGLRAHLGVSRISMASEDEAQDATGYERGTITPFGATRRWPVVADEAVLDQEVVSIGGGAHWRAFHMPGADLIAYLGADVAEVTKVRS